MHYFDPVAQFIIDCLYKTVIPNEGKKIIKKDLCSVIPIGLYDKWEVMSVLLAYTRM